MDQRERLEILLERHGRTYADELGLRMAGAGPTELWRFAVACILMSAQVPTEVAVDSAQCLFDRIGHTAEEMRAATPEQRRAALEAGGYPRFHDQMARLLGDVAGFVVEEYGGDLRQLRKRADRDPDTEVELLLELKGLGPLGVELFLREVQATWDEHGPYADELALAAARRLDFGSTAEELVELVGQRQLPRLLAALMRADLADELGAIRSAHNRRQLAASRGD